MTPADLFLIAALAMLLLCVTVLLSLAQLHATSHRWRRAQDRRLDQIERYVRDSQRGVSAEETPHETESGLYPD